MPTCPRGVYDYITLDFLKNHAQYLQDRTVCTPVTFFTVCTLVTFFTQYGETALHASQSSLLGEFWGI